MDLRKRMKTDRRTTNKKTQSSKDETFNRGKKMNTINTPMKRCLKGMFIGICVTPVVFSILLYAVYPIVLMSSIEVQRFIIFNNINNPPNPQYTNFNLYGASGTRNIYVPVKDLYDAEKILSLGVWHVLPGDLIKDSEDKANFDYDSAMENSGHDVIIFCHGNGATRIATLDVYQKLRKWFHVLGVDYRSFGDSSPGELVEEAIINDLTQFYKWVKSKTNANVYVWGHSLGTGICTEMVASLSDENILPTGLVIESGFTTIREAICHHPHGKLLSWLPWFNATILDPIENNGFLFENSKNILKVNCPIMILHAEDDTAIAFALGKELYEIAKSQRNEAVQGSVTFHQFEAHLGYDHLLIYTDPRLPKYIEDFIRTCNKFKARTNEKNVNIGNNSKQ